MAGRRCLIAIVLLSAMLHAVGIARSSLPAQDGLKFIRIARQFQFRTWVDVVRGADQHPLYPALIAVAEPATALILGRGPTSWRIAAQLVAAVASVALLVPLFCLTRLLFNERIACLAAFLYAMLPFPAEIGHDTLSDSLALLSFLTSLYFGAVALRATSWPAFVACGLTAGLGYLARPEVLLAPAAVLITAVSAWNVPDYLDRKRLARLSVLGVAFLGIVGMYTLVKGEVSEKLALRIGASMPPSSLHVRKAEQWLPPGLDDPRWDFSPKEEAEGWANTSAHAIVGRLVQEWSEGLGWVFAFFAAWGVVRDRFVRRVIGLEDPGRPDLGRRLILLYLLLFSAVLVRHALRMGYLSGRHTLTLVAVSVPWAAAGTFICARGIAITLRWSEHRAFRACVAAITLLLVLGVAFQLKPAHSSRWGHWAAGRWLVEHSQPSDAVLDTRGWAAFISGRPSYDYWHVRQAFTDAHLRYIVVGEDELTAGSRRAETLKAVIAHAATPAASFPEKRGGHGVGIRVYCYRRPESWKGIGR